MPTQNCRVSPAMSKHIIIFSHGFGVQKDSRGMFTDIAATLPKDTKTILFDYNRFDKKVNRLTVAPLSKQAQKLAKILDTTRQLYPDAVIDLVCHSQGCVAAGLAKPKGLRRIVLLAPPATLSIERMANIFAYREGAHMDIDGESLFPRRDGSVTVVPKTYWPGIKAIDPVSLYNALAKHTEVIVINAHQDEILGQTDFSGLAPHVTVIAIEAGHDFLAEARAELLRTVAEEVAL